MPNSGGTFWDSVFGVAEIVQSDVLKAQQATITINTSKKTIVSVAQSQIGVKESNKSHQKYARWYGNIGLDAAWCAMFVSWCANEAGILRTAVPKFASCTWGGIPWFKDRGKYAKSKGYFGSYVPQAGDIIFFSGKYTQSLSTHTGIVTGVSGGKVHTIEGNTSNSVAARSYALGSKYVIGYGVTNQNINGSSSATGAGRAGGSSESGGSSTGGSSSAEDSGPTSLDITTVVVKSITGSAGTYKYNALHDAAHVLDAGCEILIQNDQIYLPVVQGDITLEYERKNKPGVLTFNVLKDNILNIQEGNPVRFRVNGANVFYGYIFKKSRKDNRVITVTCYDQIRYLKNSDTLSYANKKYSDLLQMIANDYGLACGDVEDTGYVIGSRIEECSLLDMLGNASDLTVLNTGKLYVLYDDFGKLTLKNIESMKVPFLVDENNAGSFNYGSTIDSNVYNRIKIASDNDTTGEREVYVVNDADSQASWGVLQYYENVSGVTTEVIREKSKVLLDYYNRKQRTLTIQKCFGDVRVRGGSAVVVKLNLGDLLVQNYMVVEKVKHTFAFGQHLMDLDVSGVRGEFNV